MQISAGQYPFCSSKLPKPQCSSSSISSPLFFYSKSCAHCYLLPSLVLKNIPTSSVQCIDQTRYRNVGAIFASEAESQTSTAETGGAERWLLEPVGDGDTRHIGFKVSMPGAFEIASSVVTIGRLPEKVDIVIPVATVSGVHARIEKKDGVLLVTDLDSTNGTFIGEKRLKPGDTNLAIFRVSKLENIEVSGKSEESEAKAEDNSVSTG